MTVRGNAIRIFVTEDEEELPILVVGLYTSNILTLSTGKRHKKATFSIDKFQLKFIP